MEAPQGTKIDFYPTLNILPQDDGKVYRIVFTDTTHRLLAVPYEITSLSFYIDSDKLDEPYEEDLLVYLNYNRVDREWFILTSDMLGLGEGQPIPDGVYKASIVVNNTYTVEHTFILFNEVEKQITTLLSQSGYGIKVSELNLSYQYSTKYDYEQFSILASLLETIKVSALDGDIEAGEKALEQAQRVLNLITNE